MKYFTIRLKDLAIASTGVYRLNTLPIPVSTISLFRMSYFFFPASQLTPWKISGCFITFRYSYLSDLSKEKRSFYVCVAKPKQYLFKKKNLLPSVEPKIWTRCKLNPEVLQGKEKYSKSWYQHQVLGTYLTSLISHEVLYMQCGLQRLRT